MQKFIWLGASWTQGFELDKIDPSLMKTSTYPRLISNYFNRECVDLSETGGSNEYMLYALTKNKHLISKDDVVFVNSVSKYRFLWIEEDGTPAVTYKMKERGKPTIYPKIVDFYEKYIVNEEYADWRSLSTMNSIYLMIKHLGAIPLFVNVYSRTSFGDDCIIPEKNWLIPQNKCIAEYILGYISDKDLIVVNDMPGLTNKEWETAKPFVEKYIHPLETHPNVAGHKKIADELIEELKNKELIK